MKNDNSVDQARADAVIRRLRTLIEHHDTHDNKQEGVLCRAIWRVGELRLAEAVPILVDLAHGKINQRRTKVRLFWNSRKSEKQRNTETVDLRLRKYCIVWSLGRIGNPSSLETVELLAESAQGNDNPALQRICHEVRYWLTPGENRAELLTEYRAALPLGIRDALDKKDAKLLADNVSAELKKTALAWNEYFSPNTFRKKKIKNIDHSIFLIETLYLLSLNISEVRRALFYVIDELPMLEGYWGSFRSLWKISEFRRDGEMLAHLAYRLETTRSEFPRYGWSDDLNRTVLGVSRPSRDYYRRRSWRALYRLGQVGDPRYVDMATEFLLTIKDSDGGEPEVTLSSRWRYNYEIRRYEVIEEKRTYVPLVGFYAVFHILNHNSKCIAVRGGNIGLLQDEETEEIRIEAFPELWDQAPDRLMALLKQSKSKPVHDFAATALRENTEYLAQIPLDDWFALLESPFEATALLALEGIRPHYNDKNPDSNLIRMCLAAQFASIREAGMEWLAQVPQILRDDLDLFVWLITAETEDIGDLARRYFYILDGKEQQTLVSLLLARLRKAGEDLSEDIINRVGWAFLNPLKYQLQTIGAAAIADMVNHPCEHINLLAVQILAVRGLKPHDISPELYGKLFNNSFAKVRAQAIALIGNLDDREISRWHDMFSNFLLSDHEEIRREARALLRRAVAANSETAKKTLQKILPALFLSETSEGLHDDLVAVAKEDLQSAWHIIDKNQLWRLLNAQSKGAQRIGDQVLQSRAAQDYSVRQWARLGNHASLNVRQWSWRAYETNTKLVEDDFENALRLFDSDWDDSRAFAFQYFPQHFPEDTWSPEHVIALCDNKYKDVRSHGCNIVEKYIDQGHGAKYLRALSEHPSTQVQRFIGSFLKTHAGGHPNRILELKPYFYSVLSRVNKGREAKNQVLAFLRDEALRDRKMAEFTSDILEYLSLSAAVTDKMATLEMMRDIGERFPGLSMPIKIRGPETRGYQAAATPN